MKKFLTILSSLFLGFSAFGAIPFSATDAPTVAIDDTNHVVVYSIGYTNGRGIYTFDRYRAGDGFSYYTNSAGVTIQYDASNLDFYFQLTNGAGVSWYLSSGSIIAQPRILPQTFVHQTGAATPDGIITWGTNYMKVTNTAALYGSIWYVATNGSDASAQKGNPLLPARTLHRVFTNVSAGDTVFAAPGHYTNDMGGALSTGQYPEISLPNNFTFKGSGLGITFIDGLANASKWYLGNSNILSDFTSTNVWFYDRADAITTNIVIHDIAASAVGDVIVFQTGTLNANLYNLWLGGSSDKIADLSVPSGATGYLTNSIITMNNINLTGGAGAGGNGLNFGYGNGQAGLLMQARGGGIHVNVTGMVAEQHIVTNFPNAFVFAPVTQRTNIVSGQLYTNTYSVPIDVEVGVSNVLAAVNGTAKIAYWVYQQGGAASLLGETNEWGSGTTGSTVAVTNLNGTFNFTVPVGFVYTVTNQSVGTGNAAGTRGGKIKIP